MSRSLLSAITDHLNRMMLYKDKQSPWWKGVHVVAFTGLALRLWLAFVSDSIYHPDELFQYLEQGHRMVFGYGYIPWEYRYGTRSYIIPGFVSGILFVCRLLQLENPIVYAMVVKAVCSVLSVSLIYFVYLIGRNIATETAARLAAVFACIWYELIYFAHKPTPEILATYLLSGALVCLVRKPGYGNALLFGFLAGLTVAVRLQYSPVIALAGGVACLAWKKNTLAAAGLAFLAVMGLAGLLDYYTWGHFFSFYYQNYLFNAVYKISLIYGTQPALYYLLTLTIASAGLVGLALMSGCLRPSMTWLPAACILVNLGSHSLLAHKEYRFILVSIPLILLVAASGLTEGLRKFASDAVRKFFYAGIVAVVLLVSAAGLTGNLPYHHAVYAQPIVAKQDGLRAYTFLYHERNLAAILHLDEPWWKTGGYYTLHRNVPIYFPDHLLNSGIPLEEVHQYVSHIICKAGSPGLSGFKTLARIGTLEIRDQMNPPAQYSVIHADVQNVRQNEVEDRYAPTVRRRF